MGATKIEWATDTWNPVTGCTKVSPGCKNCYAERLAPRVFAGQRVSDEDRLNPGLYGPSRPRRFTDVQVHPERLDAPLRWRKPRRVFVNSMSDLFHEAVPDWFIGDVFRVMRQAQQHTFQVLTKRPERMREWISGWMVPDPEWPFRNVWLGTSVEDQQRADERIPLLLDTPAAVRFVSCEPLLGPVDVGAYLNPLDAGLLDWLIVGGESGPGARPMDLAWARSLVAQGRAAGVPVFVKQLGARPVYRVDSPMGRELSAIEVPLRDSKGGMPDEWPPDLRVREWPS